VGLLDIRVLKAVGEPIRHAVAEHQHVAFRYGVALIRRRRLGEILDPLGRLLLEWCEQVAAEPAAKSPTAGWRRRRLRRPWRPAEIEKLRGCRAHDPNQQRDRDSQYN